MAGPSIAVRVLGDLSSFGKTMADAGTKAQSFASKAAGAFHNMLGALNQSGALGPFGAVLSGVDSAIQTIVEHGKSIGPALLGAGGAVLGLGATLSAFGSKEQASHQQLQAAIEATGGAYDDYAAQVDAAVKHNEKFGDSSAQTQDALATLTQATHDPAKALQLLGTATDLAAAKHESLNSAAGALGKVYNGNTKLLKTFGIEIDKTTGKTKDGQTATQALAGVLKGQASAASDTFMGHMDALKTHVEDQVSMFGEKYGPALQGVGAVMVGLGGTMEVAKAGMEALKSSTILQTAALYAQSAAQVVVEATGAPLWLIILALVAAVAALVAIGYVLYTNWNTIWNGILAVVQIVWNWIKANWPLILGILTGPIGLAVALIWKYWSTILSGLQSVWNWIRSAWNSVYSFLTAPVAAAINWIVGAWGQVRSAVSGVISWIEGAWNGLVGWFSGLPGRMAGIFSGMFMGIWEAFKGAINMVIDGWNSLHFGIPSIDTHIPGVGKIGGGSVGVPHIPRLAQGGLITADGLVYAHAGEAITPYRPGPAVVVQQANFAAETDIDLFMRKAAWVLQTQKV